MYFKNVRDKKQKKNWMINSNAPEFVVHKEPITVEFNIQSSNQDWFHFEPNCTVLGQSLSLQEISRLAIESNGYVKTKK